MWHDTLRSAGTINANSRHAQPVQEKLQTYEWTVLSSHQSTIANGTGTILGFGSTAMPNHLQACPGMQKGAAFHCPATHLRHQGAFVVVREMLGCLEVDVAALAKGGVSHCHIAQTL